MDFRVGVGRRLRILEVILTSCSSILSPLDVTLTTPEYNYRRNNSELRIPITGDTRQQHT